MFIENKYSRTYFSIIVRAQSRTLAGYGELHHIIPRSLGGSNSHENLVKLSAREHYICHLLLPKMTSGAAYQKMIYAYTIMSGRKVYGARKYAFYREEHAKINSKLRSGPGNGMWGVRRFGKDGTFYGKHHSAESKQKMSESQKRRKLDRPDSFKAYERTAEHKKRISDARKQNSAKYSFNHHEHGSFIGSTGDLGRAYNIRGSEVYKLVKGYYKSYKGWTYSPLQN